MSTMTVKLNEVAKAVKVHPRTILRIATGNRNIYWAKGYDPKLSIPKVAAALGCSNRTLVQVLEGRDTFLKPDEAAEEVGCPPRTFRWRRYKPTIRVGGVVRFARSKLIDQNYARWEK